MKTWINISYHPWEYLIEELKARWRSQVKFASLIWVSKTELNEIIKWHRDLNAKIAYRIAIAFDEPAETWIRLQADRDTYKMIRNSQEQKIAEKIASERAVVFA